MFVSGPCDIVGKVTVGPGLSTDLCVGTEQLVVVGLQQVQHRVSLKGEEKRSCDLVVEII